MHNFGENRGSLQTYFQVADAQNWYLIPNFYFDENRGMLLWFSIYIFISDQEYRVKLEFVILYSVLWLLLLCFLLKIQPCIKRFFFHGFSFRYEFPNSEIIKNKWQSKKILKMYRNKLARFTISFFFFSIFNIESGITKKINDSFQKFQIRFKYKNMGNLRIKILC